MKARRFLIIALAAICSGCLEDVDANSVYKITVIGDSNSARSNSRTTWVQLIQDQNLLPQVQALQNGKQTLTMDVEWVNFAFVGCACVADIQGKSEGLTVLNLVIADHPDGIVFTTGSNDLETFNATAQDIVDCYLAVQAAADRVQVFFATTPPVYPPYDNAVYWNARTAELNALMRATLDPTRVIDFDTGFTDDMYFSDGRHLNQAGQQLRAERVANAIKWLAAGAGNERARRELQGLMSRISHSQPFPAHREEQPAASQ